MHPWNRPHILWPISWRRKPTQRKEQHGKTATLARGNIKRCANNAGKNTTTQHDHFTSFKESVKSFKRSHSLIPVGPAKVISYLTGCAPRNAPRTSSMLDPTSPHSANTYQEPRLGGQHYWAIAVLWLLPFQVTSPCRRKFGQETLRYDEFIGKNTSVAALFMKRPEDDMLRILRCCAMCKC